MLSPTAMMEKEMVEQVAMRLTKRSEWKCGNWLMMRLKAPKTTMNSLRVTLDVPWTSVQMDCTAPGERKLVSQ